MPCGTADNVKWQNKNTKLNETKRRTHIYEVWKRKKWHLTHGWIQYWFGVEIKIDPFFILKWNGMNEKECQGITET